MDNCNKPDYVTLDAQTGKVTFNANTIKPNQQLLLHQKQVQVTQQAVIQVH
ncbi:hypothetical protein UM538_12615 [Staphylococcus aureus]|nr:hypothetical protein UM538_12615 [Staphylococcus aureus]